MGRQPFRRRKADNTIDDGTGGGGGASAEIIKMGKMELDNANYGWNFYWPYITTQGYNQPNSGTAVLLSNQVVSYPFIARQSGDLTRMSIRITSGSGTAGAVRIAVYDSDSDGMPDTLLGIATPPNINSTGVKSVTSFTTNDGSTSATITLTENEKYWVMYGAISTVTDLPTLGCSLNQTYHASTYQPEFYLNGGGYNPRGGFAFKAEATMDTLAKLYPASWPALSSLNGKSLYNSQASGIPVWIGVNQ